MMRAVLEIVKLDAFGPNRCRHINRSRRDFQPYQVGCQANYSMVDLGLWSAPQRAGRKLWQLHYYKENGMESKEFPVDAGSPLKYRPQPFPSYENRLSIPFFVRFSAATAGAVLTGAALGVSHGGKLAGMRFRAENSHRFPATSTGWYLYHKSKNYHIMLGGIKEGLKMGSKIGFWTGSFFLVEEAVDEWRGTKDFLSTVVAGMTIAAGFSGQPWSVCFYIV